MNKVLALAFFSFLISCVSPDEIALSSDSDALQLDELLRSIDAEQAGKRIQKKVELNEERESAEMAFDTLIVQDDLKPLLEISFGHLLRDAGYHKSVNGQSIRFERKAKERKGPLSVELIKNQKGEISEVAVEIENANYLYQSDKKIQLAFNNQKLSKYTIQGSRKIIGLDPSTFLIEASIMP